MTEYTNAPGAELPKYKCYKEVWALKIDKIIYDVIEAKKENRDTDGTAQIFPKDQRYAPFKVSREYVDKHVPHPGGYYVVYKDGYKSFSPAEAFEEGYTLL